MKKIHNKYIGIALQVGVYAFIVLLTVFIYYFAKGYRINLNKQQITKTGVLNVKADPFWSDIYIDGKNSGRSPKSKSMDIGVYNVEMKKEGYRTWSKRVQIYDEKSTIIKPWLLLEEPKTSTAWNSESILENIWINKTSQLAIILLRESNSQSTLWAYRTTSSFLDFSNNLVKLFTTESKVTDLKLSPNGSKALITMQDALGNQNIYLFTTTSPVTLDQTILIDLKKYNNYTISWAEDNEHLILDSDIDIVSYNTTRKTFVILEKKDNGDKYIWSTDLNGYFYLVHKEENENTEINKYSIQQSRLDGTNISKILPEIFFQKDTTYINYYRTNPYTCVPCTNSPENTKTVGEITKIAVNPKASGIFIKTTQASYWYNILTKTYFLVSAYPSELIEYSHDNSKFIYQNELGYFTFTLLEDGMNPVEQLGKKNIKDVVAATDIHWTNESESFSFREGNKIYIADNDGQNKEEIAFSNNLKGYLVGAIKEEIYLLETDNQGQFSIIKYIIN